MQIAVLTFDRFNEIDSFVVSNLLNRVAGWRAFITGATPRIESRNGVLVDAQQPLEFAAEADAVVIGSGMKTDEIARDPATLARIRLDPARQLVAAQCSGALVLGALGLLKGLPACTDQYTRPLVERAGIEALTDRAFVAHGNVATAGGCLSAPLIAAWMIARRQGVAEAERVLDSAAPVGEAPAYVARAMAAIRPHLPKAADAA